MDIKVQRARLFIRNLSFSVTDDKLKEYYEKHGVVSEVSLLKKANGQLLGCGFVQFETPHDALEAISKTNGQMFLGRKITCQTAVYKERRIQTGVQIKEESQDTDVQIKEEPEDTDAIKEKEELLKEHNNKRKKNSARKRKASSSLEEKVDDEEDNDTKAEAKKPKLRVFSNDITQGKTVFVKNVPFTATDDDIRDCFSEYGKLEYGLVVKDKYTEHSKGTAFVKFANKEDADKCLAAGTELQMEGNILDCHIALSKQDLEKTAANRLETAQNDLNFPIKKDKQRSKFPRNLHLLNEGAVLAGSVAASTVCSADMQLRLSIVQQRQRRLRADPNLVISDKRLIVHNLPLEWTDRHLSAMCKKYGATVSKNKGKGKKRKGNVKEARIMRNRDVEKLSKCYAYVGCETHEVALNLLRAVNNNPDAFGPPPSPHKRPIVYFSLEDRRVLHKLDKRHQKPTESSDKTPSKINTKQTTTTTKKNNSDEANPSKSNPLKARLKHNPRRQIQLHREQIKERKHKQRLNKPMQEHKNHQRMSKKETKSLGKDMVSAKSRKKGKGDDDFSKIVAGYKSKLSAASLTATKTKWYET